MRREPPLRCRLGWHGSWYVDGAMFTCVRRCNRCGAAEDSAQLAVLEMELALWDEAPRVAAKPQSAWVAEQLQLRLIGMLP